MWICYQCLHKTRISRLWHWKNLKRKLNELATSLGADKLHLGATSDGLKIYKAVGYQEPRFVNLEIKFKN